MGYLNPHLPLHLPPCGVATTPDCGVLQQIPTLVLRRRRRGRKGGRSSRLSTNIKLIPELFSWLFCSVVFSKSMELNWNTDWGVKYSQVAFTRAVQK